MTPAAHTYLRTRKLAGVALTFDLAKEDATLRAQAAAAKSGRAAKTLVKEGRLRVTLIALRKGTALGAHAVQGDVTIQVLRGALELRIDDRPLRAARGAAVALQAGVRHDARATRDAAILITAAMR